MPTFKDSLAAALTTAALSFDDAFLLQCEAYAAALLEANKRSNLTAILTEKDIAEKHFADSLLLLKYAAIANGASIVDIGAGPGFPGLPLKLYRPDLQLVFLESNGKKCRFLREVISSLSLVQAEVYCGRAEEMGRDPYYRGRLHYATARAVAEFSVLLEYTMPLLSLGGTFFCLKGPEAEAEITAAEGALALLGGSIENIVKYSLGESGYRRCLLEVRKIAETPEKFPRRPGMPLKRPLR